MTPLIKTIQAEEKKRFEKEFNPGPLVSSDPDINGARVVNYSIDAKDVHLFLNQAIQRTVETTAGLILEDLKLAKEDGKYVSKKWGGDKDDPRIRVNYLIHMISQLTHSPKEDK